MATPMFVAEESLKKLGILEKEEDFHKSSMEKGNEKARTVW